MSIRIRNMGANLPSPSLNLIKRFGKFSFSFVAMFVRKLNVHASRLLDTFPKLHFGVFWFFIAIIRTFSTHLYPLHQLRLNVAKRLPTYCGNLSIFTSNVAVLLHFLIHPDYFCAFGIFPPAFCDNRTQSTPQLFFPVWSLLCFLLRPSIECFVKTGLSLHKSWG